MLQTFLRGARQALRLKRIYFVSAKGKFVCFLDVPCKIVGRSIFQQERGRLEWSSFPLLCLTLPLELNLTAYL